MSYVSYFLTASFVGIIGVAVADQTAIAKQLDDWQLLPRPQRLSELYFTDDSQLPSVVKLGATQKLAFTIHNIEHQTILYHYELIAVATDNNTTRLLGSGAVTLAHDQLQTITETVRIPSISPRIAIRVELRYQGIAPGNKTSSTQKQAIQYWVRVAGVRP